MQALHFSWGDLEDCWISSPTTIYNRSEISNGTKLVDHRFGTDSFRMLIWFIVMYSRMDHRWNCLNASWRITSCMMQLERRILSNYSYRYSKTFIFRSYPIPCILYGLEKLQASTLRETWVGLFIFVLLYPVHILLSSVWHVAWSLEKTREIQHTDSQKIRHK